MTDLVLVIAATFPLIFQAFFSFVMIAELIIEKLPRKGYSTLIYFLLLSFL